MSSTIKQAIEALKNRVADAYTAVATKGGTLPATQDSANLPAAINSIPSGGGGIDYSALLGLGFSQADLDIIAASDEDYLTPTAEEIAEAQPYMGRSGTGYRAWGGATYAHLKYIPPFNCTSSSLSQYFYNGAGTSCMVCGAITQSQPASSIGFAQGAPNMRILLGTELDLSAALAMTDSFWNCASLERIPKLKFSSSLVGLSGTFRNCYKLLQIDFGTSALQNVSAWNYAFGSCLSLKTILGDLDFSSATNVSNTFIYCFSLVNARIKNVGISLSLANSNKLSYESLLYLVQNLQNVSGQTLTIGSTNIAKLNATAEGQAAIATAQGYGWTIS